jgi:hypothetical protein
MAPTESSKEEVNSNLTLDELLDAYHDLYNLSKRLKKENKVLKDKCTSFENEKLSLSLDLENKKRELDVTRVVNIEFHEKVEDL